MMLRKLCVLIALSAAVSACAGYTPDPRFGRELNKQYQELASQEVEPLYDATDAAYFKHKGKRAAMGETTHPEDPATWDVPAEYLPELNKAYDALQVAFTLDEKRLTKPIPAAQAQAAFDCWVEQSQEKWTPQTHQQCRARFYDALCRMYDGKCNTMDRIYRVFFATGSAAIDAEARKTVEAAVASYKKGGKEVVVAGHADRVGGNAANMALSKRRAEAVKAVLEKGGIAGAKVDERYFGEEQPLIPTKDNVPNRENRRVLIVIR